MFEKNEQVIKIISVIGTKSATIQTVESVRDNVVLLVDSRLEYDAIRGHELEPVIPGCYSEIVHFDDGEVERWGLAPKKPANPKPKTAKAKAKKKK